MIYSERIGKIEEIIFQNMSLHLEVSYMWGWHSAEEQLRNRLYLLNSFSCYSNQQ